MTVFLRCAVIGVITLAVSGCVTRDNTATLAVSLPDRWSNGPTDSPSRIPAHHTTWWRGFRDPEIDRLVLAALAANPSLEQARERVVAARALARAQGAQRLPIIDGSAGATVQSRLAGPADGLNAAGEDAGEGSRRTIGTFQAGFDARWELDFFGRVRRTVLAAEYAALAASEEMQDARFTLVAEVVRTYLELRGAQARRSVIVREIAARRGLLDLVRVQQTAGSSGEFDVQRARSTYEAARAREPAAGLAIRVALQRLATLVGTARPNERLLSRSRGVGNIASMLGPVPASILRWRADVRRAELIVAQRAAESDVAYAELFPRFALAGTIDLAGNLIGRPLPGTLLTFTGGPGVSVPLLDWGLRVHVLRAREAQWREAIAAYRGSVLRAVEDVEIALATIRASRSRLDRQRTAVGAAGRALELADRQYRGGLVGLTERLQAETDLRQAELDLADATENSGVAAVALFKAFGTPPGLGGLPAAPVQVAIRPTAPAGGTP